MPDKFSLDFSPIAAVGSGMQEAAVTAQHLQAMKQEEQLRNMQIAEMKRKEAEANSLVPLSAFNDLKEKFPNFYGHMEQTARDMRLIVPGQNGDDKITNRNLDELWGMLNKHKQFGDMAITALDADLFKQSSDIKDDLTELQKKVKYDLKTGDPLPLDPDDQGKVKNLQKQYADIMNKRSNLYYQLHPEEYGKDIAESRKVAGQKEVEAAKQSFIRAREASLEEVKEKNRKEEDAIKTKNRREEQALKDAEAAKRKQMAPGMNKSYTAANVELKDGTTVVANYDHKTGKYYDPESGTDITGKVKTKAGTGQQKKGGYVEGRVNAHPLAGMKAGRYRVGGKIVDWDGTKEIQ